MAPDALYLVGDRVRLTLDGTCRAEFDIRTSSSPYRVGVAVGHPRELDGREGLIEEVWQPTQDRHVYFVRLSTPVKLLDGSVWTAGPFAAWELRPVAFVAGSKVVA